MNLSFSLIVWESLGSLFCVCMRQIEIKIPIRLVSEANISDHWTKKHKRKQKVRILLLSYLPDLSNCHLPCKVVLTRIAPRKLDDDNLRTAFKFVRDVLADKLIPGKAAGRADDDERIEWCYEQLKGNPKEYAIKIIII